MGESAGFYIYGIFRLYKVYFDNLKSHLFWINVLTANSYMYLIWEVFKKKWNLKMAFALKGGGSRVPLTNFEKLFS